MPVPCPSYHPIRVGGSLEESRSENSPHRAPYTGPTWNPAQRPGLGLLDVEVGGLWVKGPPQVPLQTRHSGQTQSLLLVPCWSSPAFLYPPSFLLSP